MCIVVLFWCVFCLFFFFKQKTAYEMRISDWSSDVCSSDLGTMQPHMTAAEVTQFELQLAGLGSLLEFGCGGSTLVAARQVRRKIGRASCRERVCQYV